MAGAQMGKGLMRELWIAAGGIQFENRILDAAVQAMRRSGECESAESTGESMRASYWPAGWELPDEPARGIPVKIPTPQFLEQRKAIILSDLKMKVEAEDWHGVADAAMDLREIEAQLTILPPNVPPVPERWEFEMNGANPNKSAYLECPQAVGHRGVEGKAGR